MEGCYCGFSPREDLRCGRRHTIYRLEHLAHQRKDAPRSRSPGRFLDIPNKLGAFLGAAYLTYKVVTG